MKMQKKLYLEILNNEPENAKAYNKLGVISAREGIYKLNTDF